MAQSQPAAQDVVVTPTNPLYITDDNRTFGRVTIIKGGQIFVQTAADIRVEIIEKQDT